MIQSFKGMVPVIDPSAYAVSYTHLTLPTKVTV